MDQYTAYLPIVLLFFLIVLVFVYGKYTRTAEYNEKVAYLRKYNDSKYRLKNIKNAISKIESEIDKLGQEMYNEKRTCLFEQWTISQLISFEGIGRGTIDTLKHYGFQDLRGFSVKYSNFLKKWTIPNDIYARLNQIEGIGPGKSSAIIRAIMQYFEYIEYALQNDLDFKGKSKIDNYYFKKNLDLNNQIKRLKGDIPAIRKEIAYWGNHLNRFNNITFGTYIFNNGNFIISTDG